MNIPSIFKNRKLPDMLSEVKMQALKVDEPILDKLSKRLDGNKCCPFMMGHPCIGDLCMMWQKYKNTNLTSGEVTEYERCSIAQLSNLIMEGNFLINKKWDKNVEV